MTHTKLYHLQMSHGTALGKLITLSHQFMHRLKCFPFHMTTMKPSTFVGSSSLLNTTLFFWDAYQEGCSLSHRPQTGSSPLGLAILFTEYDASVFLSCTNCLHLLTEEITFQPLTTSPVTFYMRAKENTTMLQNGSGILIGK